MDSTPPPQVTLKDAFHLFTANKNEIDGKQFAKLCKDCHLIDKTLFTPTGNFSNFIFFF
jgi:cytochrome c2